MQGNEAIKWLGHNPQLSAGTRIRRVYHLKILVSVKVPVLVCPQFVFPYLLCKTWHFILKASVRDLSNACQIWTGLESSCLKEHSQRLNEKSDLSIMK